MTPWFILQLLGSPISMVMHVCERQRSMLLLTISGFLLRVGAIGGAAIWNLNILSESYSIASALYYLMVLIVCSRVAGIQIREFRRIIKGSFTAIISWSFIIFLFEFIDYSGHFAQ